MLKILVGAEEHFDEATSEIKLMGGTTLEFEHSLVSLSKWEQKYEKPFLGQDEKTPEEILGYIECMIVTPDPPPDVILLLEPEHFRKITDYINAKMTATWFRESGPKKSNSETITAELIYYWMASADIPIEHETWHLNRLLTLLKVFEAKNQKPEKQSAAEAAAERRAENERRMKEYGTTG